MEGRRQSARSPLLRAAQAAVGRVWLKVKQPNWTESEHRWHRGAARQPARHLSPPDVLPTSTANRAPWLRPKS